MFQMLKHIKEIMSTKKKEVETVKHPSKISREEK